MQDLIVKSKMCRVFDSEYQIRIRIIVAIAAYAYEFGSSPIMSDDEFDKLCGEVDTTVQTPRPDLDDWFAKNFSPSTSMWIQKHPDLKTIKLLYEMYWLLKPQPAS